MSTLIIWPVWRIALVVVLSALLGGFVWNLILLISYIIRAMREPVEMEEIEPDSCEGCKWNLGGGCCSLNVEDECAAGGGYELWEGEEDV